MNPWIQLAAAFAGSFGFAMLFNIHGRKLLLSSLGGLLSWGVYLLAEHFGLGDHPSAFCASVALTLYSEGMARVCRVPVTLFLVTSAIPLIPGASLYYTAQAMMLQQWSFAAQKGLYTLLFSASMSAGITLTTLFFRMFLRHVRQAH